MLLTGAEIIVECLLEQEVDTVFGYPGGTILNVYDALYDKSDSIRHILTSHEQGAAHAADGYARSTGKTGVCLATSGPGCTNLVTGIASAFYDSSPVVFITCNVSEPYIGKDTFQEVDIIGITMPITKCNFMVKDVNSLADIMREAFALAKGGRPGPVLIDIVKNVTSQECEYEFLPRSEHAKCGRLNQVITRGSQELKAPEPDKNDVKKLIRMIKRSKRPFVICGGGVVRSRSHNEFREFVTKIDSPCAVTVMGCGGIPGTHPLLTGMIGMHGSMASNMATKGCDLLIAVGCRFSERVILEPSEFAKKAKIVQIDIDRSEIDKNIKTDHHIIGDAGRVLELLCEGLDEYRRDEWKEYVFSFPTETEYDEGGDTLTPKQISSTIAKKAPSDSIIATDVGQHQMWAIQHFHFKYPGQLLTSGGFGAMGFGLGAAIGAKAGNPDKTVFHITGDGCFRMNFTELSTETFYDLPVITVVYDNKALGMVRQWQTLLYNKRYAATTMDRGPDFVKLAEAYGIGARYVSKAEELEDALDEALSTDRGYIIVCAVDIDEMVRPMVNLGDSITDFLVN